MILAVLEGIAMCFVLLIICVVGIANGPVGMVFFYEKEVQEKAIELGLTSRETIRKRKMITYIAILVPQFLLVPLTVYLVNGAPDFRTAAVQMTVIYLISGLFDRLFIDWYWVGKTKAWIIPGTECVLRRRADTGAFASGHSAATTDSTLISHFAFNHNDVMFRHSLE